MYKVLLVDDDSKVHMGLTKYVKWNDYGFCIEGTAKSKDEALDKLMNNHYDLMITDIRMPGGTGLELLDEIRSSGDDISVAILSGYGEFDYARQAMKNGALSYLMKPVDFDELHRLLGEVKKNLDDKNHSAKQYEAFLLERAVHRMLRNQDIESEQTIGEKIAWIKKDGAKAVFRLQYLGDDTDSDREAFVNTWSEATAKCQNVLVQKGIHEYVAVIEMAEDCRKLLDEMIIPKGWAVGMSSVRQSGDALGEMYEEASRAVYLHGLYKGQVVFFEALENNLLYSSNLDNALEEKLERDLSIANYSKFIERLQKAFNEKASLGLSLDYLLQFMIQVTSIIQRYFIEHQMYGRIQDKVHSLNRNIVLCNSSDRVLSESLAVLEEVFKICQESRNSSGIVDKAIAYIDQNYGKDISLEIVADSIFIHPIYLSRVFKEKTGSRFSEYLTRVRLNKAKELLEDHHLKTYQISEMIGYESPKYFSRVFKENIGCSPRDYRRSLGDGSS